MLSYNDVLNKLQDYMLDNDNIKKSLELKFNFNSKDKNEHPLVKHKNNKIYNVKKNDTIKSDVIKNNIIIPNEEDKLFWCFYIIKYGEIKYETLNNKNLLVAKQIKIDLVSDVRKNKDTVKLYKFDTISNIESNLANDNELNIKTFLTLCAINNINVVYISKKTYYKLVMNDNDEFYLIHEITCQNNKINYGFEICNSANLENIISKLYQIDKINKPIKSLSSYKVKDLIDICNKLAIENINKENGNLKSKNELYQLIVQYF